MTAAASPCVRTALHASARVIERSVDGGAGVDVEDDGEAEGDARWRGRRNCSAAYSYDRAQVNDNWWRRGD